MIAKGSFLNIEYNIGNSRPFGILTNDYELAKYLKSPKAYIQIIDKLIESKAISIEQKRTYKYHLVFNDWLEFVNTPFLIHDGRKI